jgi:glycosyltransferase involved in cell wall biosynthesis
MNNPLFSVIIPTYNRALNLKIALNSLLEQTFRNFEVIVCDDGSTDNTRNIVEFYAKTLNITYLWEENWGGPARPRNSGIKVAKSEWICFLDSDDWWYPNKLELCAKLINDFDFIHHNFDTYRNLTNDIIGTLGSGSSKNYYKDLLYYGNFIINSSVVVKKTLIEKAGGFLEDKDVISIEDYILWLNVSRLTSKFVFIKESLGGYSIGDNISSDFQKVIEKELYFINKYMEKSLRSEVISSRYFVWILRYLNSRHLTIARIYFIKLLFNKFSFYNLKLSIKAALHFIIAFIKFPFKWK